MEWLIPLLKQIAARAGSAAIVAGARRFKFSKRLGPLIGTLVVYRRRLRRQLKDMPFIYRGLEAEIATDFVDVELLGIDLETLESRVASAAALGSDEKLRTSRRVLFLGNAGAGKTTFQRYAILQYLAGGDRFFYRQERLVPVYIPLKAVDNSLPLPIFRYLLNRHPLFGGVSGSKLLARLLRGRRLFLCLDGYDEISFLAESRNHVQDELSSILDFKPGESIDAVLSKRWFYQGLRECRVWISSRREFFERNPVPRESLKRRRLQDLAALELMGVGANRVQLARRIFDKYKRHNARARELLSEEKFLYSVDDTLDDEMRSLSRNPLFLTVMCYLYADKVLGTGAPANDWLQHAEDLIEGCVILLLNDLDEQKARDLPLAQREGLLRRRNEYPELKLAFLEYFAGRLFLEQKSVFGLGYIKSTLLDFVKLEDDDGLRKRIERDLSADVAVRPNVALQLVYCGIFVLVAYQRDGAVYDFPHRRFREVLAAKHFSSPENYSLILADLRAERFAELLKVFRASRRFNDKLFQESVLQRLLDECLREPGADRAAEIVNYLWAKPAGVDVERVFRNFLTIAMSQPTPAFRVTKLLWDEVSEAGQLVDLAEISLREAMKSDHWRRASLACGVLRFLQPNLLLMHLTQMKGDTRKPVRGILANQLLRFDRPEAFELATTLFRDSYFRLALAHCLGRYWPSCVWSRVEKELVVNRLSYEERALLAHSGWRAHGDDVRAILEQGSFYFPVEIFPAAERLDSARRDKWMTKEPREVFAVTERALLGVERGLELLQRERAGAVVFDEEFSLKEPGAMEAAVPGVLLTSREISKLATLIVQELRKSLSSLTTNKATVDAATGVALDEFLKNLTPSQMRLRAYVERDRVVRIDEFMSMAKSISRKQLRLRREEVVNMIELSCGPRRQFEGVEEFFV